MEKGKTSGKKRDQQQKRSKEVEREIATASSIDRETGNKIRESVERGKEGGFNHLINPGGNVRE